MAIYGYTKNYKLIKPQFNTDTWHDYIYDNLDTIDAVMSAIYASGNWKGFWAKNMTYVTGDVIIDQDTDTMYKVMIDHVTSADTFAAEQTAHPDYYELWSPNNLAESWAIKTDSKVSNTDYSAKAYAISSGLVEDGSAKEWAVGSGAIGNTNEYSAKKYATDAHNDYISLTTNVNIVAVGSNIDNVNAVGQSISSVNTVANNVSSVNTVAGSISDVNTVASIASSVSTVANNDANITTVATNISDVNTAATNIESIKAAPTAATNAANSATASANSATVSAASAQQAAISAAGTHFKLFQHQWFDYELNDMAWLRADTFSWQSGTVYTNAYNHLVDDINGISPATETVSGQTVTFYRAADGHKIVLADQETTVDNIYTATGVAWYYILDTVNNRFKLPRTKHDFNGLRGDVGDYIPESLPNITGNVGSIFNRASGAFSATYVNPAQIAGGSVGSNYDNSFDASRSSSTYQNNAPVQQRGTQQYLYFYVGQYTQSAIEQTAGLNAELFNNKVDIDGNNVITAGANKILNTSSYTTNRILEIPQDIKLELNNGLLTLKAGSKVYVPNGFEADGTTPKFDVVVIERDLQATRNLNLQEIYFIGPNSEFYQIPMQYCYSGSTTPSSFFGDLYAWWYDTTSNILKRTPDGGTTWVNNWSLPVCLATSSTTQITSIDQIFNGFGYIGSTVFALPGVRGLNGKGRQADGTFLTEIREVKSVLTTTVTAISDRLIGLFLYPVGEDEYGLGNANAWELRFSYEENCMYSGSTKFFGLKAAEAYYETTPKLSLFRPISVDSVLNSNLSNLSATGQAVLDAKANAAQFQVVSALPAEPDPNVFYFIPE